MMGFASDPPPPQVPSTPASAPRPPARPTPYHCICIRRPATPPPIASPSMPVFQLLISGPISSGEGARPAFSGCITNGRGAGDEEEQEWPALLLRDQAGQRREAARFQPPLVLTPADVGGGGASPRLLGLMCCRGVVSSASPGGSGAGSRDAEQEEEAAQAARGALALFVLSC